LSKKRLQPYLGIRYAYSGYFENKGEDNEISHTYQSAIPSVGLRYFISNRVSLNVNLGYQIGYSYFDESFYSGFTPSIGIGFALFTK
jgi:hypothetical protein